MQHPLVEVVDTGAAVSLDLIRRPCHALHEHLKHGFDQVCLKLREEELQVVIHEVQGHLVSSSVHFFVGDQLLVVANAQRGQNKLAELRKYAVVVVLADGEVDVVASDHVEVHGAELADVAPLSFVLVSIHVLGPEAVPELQKLHCILGCLFEHNQAVDVPGVKANSVLPVQHELSQKLESDQHYFIVGVEGV